MKKQGLAFCSLGLWFALAPLCADEPPTSALSHVVGSVFGKSITAADIGLKDSVDIERVFDARDTQQWRLMQRVMTTFGTPIIDRFSQQHDVVATAEELAAFKANSRQLRQIRVNDLEARLLAVKKELATAKLAEKESEKLQQEQADLRRTLHGLRKTVELQTPDELARQFIVARKIEQQLQRKYGGKVIFQQFGPEALDARRRLYEEAEKKGELAFQDAGVRHLFYYYYGMRHVAIDADVLEQDPETRLPPTATTKVPAQTSQPPVEKAWMIEESKHAMPDMAPRQIVPVESGVWFGGRQPGRGAAPLGFFDASSGQITLLMENAGKHWDAVGSEAIAVQLDRKSLVRLNAAERAVTTWDNRPDECKFFSQVVAYQQHFCVSSPYQPLWAFDCWLRTWQKIELKLVTDSDSERLGAGYYRPSMNRFVIGDQGVIWGFQGTHDATRGNAVCRYDPRRQDWQHFGFPWAVARGDDHWAIGDTADAVVFAGRKDLLLLDKTRRRWSSVQPIWPRGSEHSVRFTQQGILLGVGNTVKQVTDDLAAWKTLATLDDPQSITAIAATEESLYLATARGLHVWKQLEEDQWVESAFHPWVLAADAKVFKAVFGLPVKSHALELADKLCQASSVGDLEQVRALLADGADTETTTDAAGSTPLLLACGNGHLPVVKLLIENGADLHAKNMARQNALTLAAQGGYRELADYLLSKGVRR